MDDLVSIYERLEEDAEERRNRVNEMHKAALNDLKRRFHRLDGTNPDLYDTEEASFVPIFELYVDDKPTGRRWQRGHGELAVPTDVGSGVWIKVGEDRRQPIERGSFYKHAIRSLKFYDEHMQTVPEETVEV